MNFQVGQPAPSLLPLDIVREVAATKFAEEDPLLLQYGYISGYPAFRNSLADFLSSEDGYGVDVDPERLFVTIPLSFLTDQIGQVGEEPVRVEILNERMRQELLGRSDRDVFVRGDGGITYQELMSVMDALKDGGVANVGLLADFPVEP